MAQITLNTHGTSPDSWASNFPGTTLNITTTSVSIRVNHPLYGGTFAGDIGRWTEKDGKIGNEVNWETEAFTFDGLSTGANYLRLYAVDADGDPEYNTGPDNNLGPYWVSAVTVNVSSAPSCTFSNTPTVNSDVTGDTGAATGADATIARVSTNWASACSKQVAWSYATTTTPGAFVNGTDISVPRGNSVYLYASASGVNLTLRSAAVTIPYLSPKNTGITVANAPVTASADTGYWTATLSGVDTTKHTNYAVASSASTADSNSLIHSGQDVEGATGLDPMDSGVNGSAITVNQTTINTSVSNAPVGTGTTTMYLWCSRTSPSGGAGGNGWGHVNDGYSWQPVLDGSGNTVSFTVTRSNENVQNSTGSYYDTSTDTGAKHSVTLTGLVAGKYYNVTSSSGNSVASSSTWANGSSAATATLTINDTSQTVPSGTGSTTTTYTMWSNSSASWTGASSLGTTYTRTLLNYDRYDLSDVGFAAGATTSSYTIANTISGHTYYIRKSSTTGAIVGQATATGTSTTLTITLGSTDLGATAGNTLTLYLTITSPFNESPGSDYDSGKTFSAIRTSSGTTSTVSAGTYGMEIRNSQSEVIYDTTSKIGRIVTTGTTAPVSAQNTSNSGSYNTVTTTVTGMENTNNYNILVRGVPHANATTFQQGYVDRFTISKSTNSFTITNKMPYSVDSSHSVPTSYAYVVIRSG